MTDYVVGAVYKETFLPDRYQIYHVLQGHQTNEGGVKFYGVKHTILYILLLPYYQDTIKR